MCKWHVWASDYCIDRESPSDASLTISFAAEFEFLGNKLNNYVESPVQSCGNGVR